ncbi:MAG: FAD-dependent oxidoreductase [Flavobacteriales bacterium]|nr:FAD-dependent oxidoreductase [Flavobacteriales bacterium]
MQKHTKIEPYDYLIVGQGLAGSFFVHELIKHNKSFLVIDENFQKASSVSAGIYNPVVLKRFTPIWNAYDQAEQLVKKVKEIEKVLDVQILHEENVLRILHDEKEKETWIKKSKTERLSPFLDSEIINKDTVTNSLGLAKVKHSGRVNIPKLVNSVKEFLVNRNQIKEEKFDYNSLNIDNKICEYKGMYFKKVIFCEGYQVINNPFFNFIPILKDKGEQLKIKLEKELDNSTYKKKYFLFKQDNAYYTGGTYDATDSSEHITEDAKEKLTEGLEEMLDFDYEILEHNWGFRPVSKDRRPIIGSHKEHKNVFVLNGLGTRGTLIGATFSEELFNYCEYQTPISDEVNISRFY